MDKALRKQYVSELNSIIKELINASNKLSYEERFDVASLKNNIYNVKISHDIDYIYRFYESYVGGKIVNNFNYLKDNEASSYIKEHYESVDELKEGIATLVKQVYIEDQIKTHKETWIKKHLKPVIAYDKVNIITMFKKRTAIKRRLRWSS